MSEHITFTAAVWNQPEALAAAVSRISASVDAAKIAPWRVGETVAVVSMGASSHSAHALVAALTGAGVRAVNITASDLYEAAPGYEPGDHYLVVSESGRSPEPIRAARALGGGLGRRIGITNFPGAAISEVIDSTIDLGGFEDSPVYTVGYNATLIAYSALLRAAGHAEQAIDEAEVPGLVQEALDTYGPLAATLAAHLADVGSVDFVGRGFSFTSAAQSALIFREALRLPTAAYETYQYLHGPMESGRSGTGLIVFGDGRELPMLASQLHAGVKVILITTAAEDATAALSHENLQVVRVPEAAVRFSRAIVEIIAIHVLTEAMAAARGLVVEEFLYSQNDTKLKMPSDG